jgi:hypothetical protein
MIANVKGSRSLVVVPRPSTLSSSISPRNASTFRRTTSMPTPRPERSLTESAVENPASNTRFRISRSDNS